MMMGFHGTVFEVFAGFIM